MYSRSRLALVIFAATGLTALGCSLIVDFDESRIPGDPTADTGAEVASETGTTDTGTPIDTATDPDTGTPGDTGSADSGDTALPDAADSGSDSGDTGSADSGSADSGSADSGSADSGSADSTSDATDSAADAADTTPDTADTAAPDTADTAAPDTADTAAPDTADTAAEDSADAVSADAADAADTATTDSADAADATVLVSFAADIQPIFDARCVSCHGGSGGLNLASGSSYANLVNVDAACGSGKKRVAPGSPSTSELWLKTGDDPAKCGSSMPQGQPPLKTDAPADFAKIEAWINQGALNN